MTMPTQTTPTPAASRLDELDARQDDVLVRLDELNAQILDLLKEFGVCEPRDEVSRPASNEQQRASCFVSETTPVGPGVPTCQSLATNAVQAAR